MKTQKNHSRRPQSIRFIGCLGILLCLGCAGAQTQTVDPTSKLRLANALEQSGDTEHALQLFRELYARDPFNQVYSESLERCLVQAKRYDEAVTLLQERIKRSPRDIALFAELGSVYYRAGHEQESSAAWEQASAIDPENPVTYNIIAGAMVDLRLLDKAVDVYHKGRIAMNDRDAFILELAQLHTATMNYAGAAEELVHWLTLNPGQTSLIQNRLGVFTAKDEGRQAAIAGITRAIGGSIDKQLYDLLSWLYTEAHEFDRAFDAAMKLDDLQGRNGAGILAFAERAVRERAYSVGIRAYKAALDLPLNDQRRCAALFGLALAMETVLPDSLGVENSGDDRHTAMSEVPSVSAVLNAFRSVVSSCPKTDLAGRSYLHIGGIMMDRENNLDGAKEAFEHARTANPKRTSFEYEPMLRLGVLAELRADTAEARRWFTLVEAAPDAAPDQGDEAAFRLAELGFYEGRFEEALHLLEALSLNVKADYANDAIALKAFLQENIGSQDALAAFARADFMGRQRHNSEAIALFHDVAERFPQTLLVDDAMMKMAGLQAHAGQFQDAVRTYTTVIEKFAANNVLLDRAQFELARVYDVGLHSTSDAIAAYEKLLATYPSSLFADDARRRIRALRGEAQ